MKIRSIVISLLALVALAAFTGCATPGYKQADKTGQGIADFRAEIVKGKQNIDETVKALDQIAVNANTNPRKAFDKFSKSVDELSATADRARKRGQEMQEQGKAYFAKWEKDLAEVKDEEIRKLAVERRAKLQETFDRIRKYSEPLKAQFGPWMTDLKDLQTYLSNDLTIAGVDAVKDRFAKTKADGMEVQKSMDGLVAELNTIAATITPAKGK